MDRIPFARMRLGSIQGVGLIAFIKGSQALLTSLVHRDRNQGIVIMCKTVGWVRLGVVRIYIF